MNICIFLDSVWAPEVIKCIKKVDTFNYPKIKSSKPLCLEITPATASGILYQKRSGSLHDLGFTS